MDPFFPHPDLKYDGLNSDTVLSKARTIVKEYKNNPAYLEFWPLVEVLDVTMAKYAEQNAPDAMDIMHDVLFEIHLIELFQTADKKYNMLKESVKQAVENGGPDVDIFKKHYDKFIRIEQEYVS